MIGGDYQNNPQKEEYFGWKPEWDTPSGWRAADGTDERAAQEASIRKYARMLADSVYTGGYSGIEMCIRDSAKELAGADDMIFIGGSTYVVAEAL